MTAVDKVGMSFVKDLLDRPAALSAGSKYAVVNGYIYLALGLMFIAWPGVTQAVFLDRAFVGDEGGLIRVIGLTVVVIGWLYVFGGRTGGRQFSAASVVDRLVFVPLVLLPLAIADMFPHVLVAFTILDMTLAVGAWLLLRRS